MIEKLGKSEREKNTRQVASVAAFKDGKLLFGLRGDVKKWCMPGGHLNPGEKPSKGAVRELLEETGLKAKSLERLGSAIAGKKNNVQIHSYRVDVEGEPDASKDPDAEFVEFRWVDPDDIPEDILADLYNKNDVTLQLLGAQAKTLELSKASLAEIMARTKVVSDHMRALAAQGDLGHVFPHPAGGHVMVSRDPSKPGKWRATRIGLGAEPMGHIEADDMHGAIRHAHSYGADVMAVQPFKKSAEQWLTKATRPQDFKHITKAVTPEGRRFVDHTSQLQAHPPEHAPVVEHYENEIVRSGKIHTPKKGNPKEGITRKLIFKTEHQPQGDLLNPTRHGVEAQFMVKPYHENVPKRIARWQRFPIQGWAEMANQALYHAGGIGHLHQRVHVSEHEMASAHGGVSKEPALVVHMEKGMIPACDARGFQQDNSDQNAHDAMRISIMDFLTNNLDRHGGNLLLEKEAAQPTTNATSTIPEKNPVGADPDSAWMRNELAMPTVKRIMAIDHGRSFQYVNNYHHVWDKLADLKKNRHLEDSFRPYLFGTNSSRPATSLFVTRPRTFDEKQEFLRDADRVFDWWGKAGPKVRETMYQQLEHIKDPEAKAHIKRNFDERSRWLDERAELGIDNYGLDWYDDPVIQYHTDQKSDHEHEAEKRSAAIAQYEREEAERQKAKGA